ncbi:MAG: VWA domain-containing protein [bacterium]|nr:VWA domain-containing protein [bacterium]
MIRLAHPALLAIGVLLILPYLIRTRRVWLYPSSHLLPSRRGVGFGVILTTSMTIVAFILLLIALARPQRSEAITHRVAVARDIILVLDLSLSMEGHLTTTAVAVGNERQSKLVIIQEAALTFVQRHPNDRLGLIVFGDEAFGAWPLSTDHATLNRRLHNLDSLLPTALRGTHLSKALVKSLDHLDALAQSRHKLIVLLTDGLDTIQEEVQEQLRDRFHKHGIHFYVLGIQLPSDASLVQFTDRAEGRYYDIDKADQLEQALLDVERLEPSEMQIQQETNYQELFPFFGLPGLVLLLGSMIGKSIWIFDA